MNQLSREILELLSEKPRNQHYVCEAVTEALVHYLLKRPTGKAVTAAERRKVHQMLAWWFDSVHEADVNKGWQDAKMKRMLGESA